MVTTVLTYQIRHNRTGELVGVGKRNFPSITAMETWIAEQNTQPLLRVEVQQIDQET